MKERKKTDKKERLKSDIQLNSSSFKPLLWRNECRWMESTNQVTLVLLINKMRRMKWMGSIGKCTIHLAALFSFPSHLEGEWRWNMFAENRAVLRTKTHKTRFSTTTTVNNTSTAITFHIPIPAPTPPLLLITFLQSLSFTPIKWYLVLKHDPGTDHCTLLLIQ